MKVRWVGLILCTAVTLTCLLLWRDTSVTPSDEAVRTRSTGNEAPPFMDGVRVAHPSQQSVVQSAADPHAVREMPAENRLKCIAHLPAYAGSDPSLQVWVRVAGVRTALDSHSDGSWAASVDIPQATILNAHPIQLFVESARFCHVSLALTVSRNLVREGTAHFAVDLREAARADIKVTDDVGAPAAGCEIWFNHNAPQSCGRGAVTTRKLVTGADGRGELAGLEPGRWTWEVTDAKWWDAPEPGAFVARVGDPAVERIVVPRLDTTEYASGRFVLDHEPDEACIGLTVVGAAVAENASIPLAASGDFYLDLASGESADIQLVDSCSKRKSKPVHIMGGTHGVSYNVEWK